MEIKLVAKNIQEIWKLMDEGTPLESIWITPECEEEIKKWLEDVTAEEDGNPDLVEKLEEFATTMSVEEA